MFSFYVFVRLFNFIVENLKTLRSPSPIYPTGALIGYLWTEKRLALFLGFKNFKH